MFYCSSKLFPGTTDTLTFPVKAGLKTAGSVQYEIAIPFSFLRLTIQQFFNDTLRVQLLSGNFTPDRGVNECYGWWPQDADSMGKPMQFSGIAFTPAGVETLDSLPTHIELFQNTPNPAFGKIVIRYALPYSAKVELKIYNISGQLVRTLVNKEEKTGYKEVQWDGKDTRQKTVKSGIYFYTLKVSGVGNYKELKKKMLFME